MADEQDITLDGEARAFLENLIRVTVLLEDSPVSLQTRINDEIPIAQTLVERFAKREQAHG